MFLEMHGVGCAECGRPVTAWVDRTTWPCGRPALGGAPPSGDGPRATVLPLAVLPRRAPQHLAVSA